jgi:hypothetical protein
MFAEYSGASTSDGITLWKISSYCYYPSGIGERTSRILPLLYSDPRIPTATYVYCHERGRSELALGRNPPQYIFVCWISILPTYDSMG